MSDEQLYLECVQLARVFGFDGLHAAELDALRRALRRGAILVDGDKVVVTLLDAPMRIEPGAIRIGGGVYSPDEYRRYFLSDEEDGDV